MKKTAYLGVLISLALIMSYVETFIPMPATIPGIKLGLANLVVVFTLYKIDIKSACIVSIIRVIMAGFLFGNMSSIIYGLAGAVFALILMSILKCKTSLNVITVSICGAMAHIVGQIFVAGLVTSYEIMAYYAPYLLLAAFVSGAVIGVLSAILINRIPIDME